MGLGRSGRLHEVMLVEEEEKDLLLWWYEGGNHNSVLLWPGYPPTCKTKTSGLRSLDHNSQSAKKPDWADERYTNCTLAQEKQFTDEHNNEITRRNPVDSALLVQWAVAFSTSCRGCPFMVLWMRIIRNTVESHILTHSLTRKTKVTGHLLEDKTANIDPKCKLYIMIKEVCSSLLHYSQVTIMLKI